jgi:hypothetical protein
MAEDNIVTDTIKPAAPPLVTAETDRDDSTAQEETIRLPSPFQPSFRLYAIVIGLGIANLLAALENTVVAIAAPVILTDLELGDNFIWITNAFFLSRYVYKLPSSE